MSKERYRILKDGSVVRESTIERWYMAAMDNAVMRHAFPCRDAAQKRRNRKAAARKKAKDKE